MTGNEVGRQAVEVLCARDGKSTAELAQVPQVLGHQHCQFVAQTLQADTRGLGSIDAGSPEIAKRALDVIARLGIESVETEVLERAKHVRSHLNVRRERADPTIELVAKLAHRRIGMDRRHQTRLPAGGLKLVVHLVVRLQRVGDGPWTGDGEKAVE